MVEKVKAGKALSDEQTKETQPSSLFALEKPGERVNRFAGSLEQLRQMRRAISDKIEWEQQRENPWSEVAV